MAEFAPKLRQAVRNILIYKEIFYLKASAANHPQTTEPGYFAHPVHRVGLSFP